MKTIYKISHIEELTDKVTQVFLHTQKKHLDYQAGQYLKILLDSETEICYSIANAPLHPGEIELHIRHTSHNQDSERILREILTKHEVTVQGPFGKCIYHSHSQRSTLLLAAGTGFAPMKAIVEQAIAENDITPIHLYWGASTLSDLYLDELPKQWMKQKPNFRYTPVLSSPHAKWRGAVGYIDEIAAGDYSNLSNYQVYAAGPPEMAKAAFLKLQKHGLDALHFHSDTFTP